MYKKRLNQCKIIKFIHNIQFLYYKFQLNPIISVIKCIFMENYTTILSFPTTLIPHNFAVNSTRLCVNLFINTNRIARAETSSYRRSRFCLVPKPLSHLPLTRAKSSVRMAVYILFFKYQRLGYKARNSDYLL